MLLTIKNRSVYITIYKNQPTEIDNKNLNFLEVLQRINKKIINEELEFQVKLLNVQEIQMKFDASVSVTTGIKSAILYPWYIKPVQISLKGLSYMGAFVMDKGDEEANKSLQLFWEVMSEVQTQRKPVILKIENNPKEFERFKGFLYSLELKESIVRPFVFDYSIDFIGKKIL